MNLKLNKYDTDKYTFVCSCCSKSKVNSKICQEDSTNFQEKTSAITPKLIKVTNTKRQNTDSCNFRFTAKYFEDEQAYRIVKLILHNHEPSQFYVRLLLITLHNDNFYCRNLSNYPETSKCP